MHHWLNFAEGCDSVSLTASAATSCINKFEEKNSELKRKWVGHTVHSRISKKSPRAAATWAHKPAVALIVDLRSSYSSQF